MSPGILAAAVVACAVVSANAQSQTTSTEPVLHLSKGSGPAYPSKPIRIIVANAPGGGSDLVARLVAEKLSRPLGRHLFVENREGASGQIGTEVMVKSPPDGYTLLLGTSLSMITSPALNSKLTYKSPADFAPISLLGTTAYVLLVHPSVAAKSV